MLWPYVNNHYPHKALIHARTLCVFPVGVHTSVQTLTRVPTPPKPPEYRAKTTLTQPLPRP